jgi:prolyl-tRNA synthetase
MLCSETRWLFPLDQVRKALEQELENHGSRGTYFPLFTTRENLSREQEHLEGFIPEVAWVQEPHIERFKKNKKEEAEKKEDQSRLAIRPTSETIIYPIVKNWFQSYQDLPLKINQTCNVVRWEFKDATPFLRSREFLWNEGHSFFASKGEAEAEIFQIVKIYDSIFTNFLHIPTIIGRKSENEKFAGSDYTVTFEVLIPEAQKGIQGATIHHLGKHFSRPEMFDLSFVDKDNETKAVYQNCYGLTTRVIGIMLMIHGDDKGLVLPFEMAPTQFVIVPIFHSKTSDEVKMNILKKSLELEELLKAHNLRVVIDDRDQVRPGAKYNFWEMKGACYRVEIGAKDLESKHLYGL